MKFSLFSVLSLKHVYTCEQDGMRSFKLLPNDSSARASPPSPTILVQNLVQRNSSFIYMCEQDGMGPFNFCPMTVLQVQHHPIQQYLEVYSVLPIKLLWGVAWLLSGVLQVCTWKQPDWGSFTVYSVLLLFHWQWAAKRSAHSNVMNRTYAQHKKVRDRQTTERDRISRIKT